MQKSLSYQPPLPEREGRVSNPILSVLLEANVMD